MDFKNVIQKIAHQLLREMNEMCKECNLTMKECDCDLLKDNDLEEMKLGVAGFSPLGFDPVSLEDDELDNFINPKKSKPSKDNEKKDVRKLLGKLKENDNDFACPGCGSLPGDGYGKDCYHPEGCGFFKDEAENAEEESYDDFACPGCGSLPGDGYGKDCYHPEGCGFFKDEKI